MRYLILSLLLFGACDGPGDAAGVGAVMAPDAGADSGAAGAPAMAMVAPDGGAGAGGQAGAVTAAAWTSGSDAGAVPAGQIQVTWTFKACGDNAVSIGVTDMTTGKGLAGPISVKKPQGNVFTLAHVTFTCASGDIVCWTSSDGSGMCGACADGQPVIGC